MGTSHWKNCRPGCLKITSVWASRSCITYVWLATRARHTNSRHLKRTYPRVKMGPNAHLFLKLTLRRSKVNGNNLSNYLRPVLNKMLMWRWLRVQYRNHRSLQSGLNLWIKKPRRPLKRKKLGARRHGTKFWKRSRVTLCWLHRKFWLSSRTKSTCPLKRLIISSPVFLSSLWTKTNSFIVF